MLNATQSRNIHIRESLIKKNVQKKEKEKNQRKEGLRMTKNRVLRKENRIQEQDRHTKKRERQITIEMVMEK